MTEPLTREQIERYEYERGSPAERLRATALHYEARLRDVEAERAEESRKAIKWMDVGIEYKQRAEKAETYAAALEASVLDWRKGYDHEKARVAELEAEAKLGLKVRRYDGTLLAIIYDPGVQVGDTGIGGSDVAT